MNVDNVTFQTNNVVGNFNYPPNVPAYKPTLKFLLNCPLRKAFTNCPSVVYQNFLREFWSTVVAYDPFPSTDETEQHPLRDFLIKFLPGIPSNSNFTKDPSKVTDIDMKAHMIAVNSQKDSMSPLPFPAKPKKGKSHTVTLTLPKSQGPKVPGALSMKSKRPKSKSNPLRPSTGLPSTLDEGNRKSQPLPEGPTTHPKDSGGNIQPLDRDLTSTTSEKGTAKTTPRPDGSLKDKDSRGNIPPANIEPIHPTIVDLSGTGAKYQHEGELDTQPLVLSTYADVRAFLLSNDEAQESEEDILGAASETDSTCDDILKKYDNILPLTERQLVKYLRKVSNALFARITEDNWEKHEEVAVNYADLKASIDDYYDENIAHRDQTDKLVEASMSSLDKSSNTINEELVAWAKSSTNMAWNLGSRLSVPLTQAQPITTITTHPESSQAAPRSDKRKGIATELDKDPSKKLVSASTIVCPDPDEEVKVPYMINGKMYYLTDTEMQAYMDKEEKLKKADEEARLLAITKHEDAEHEVLKIQHIKKVRKSLELRKHKFENYMWTISSRLKPETIIDIKIYAKTKPDVITVFRGTDGRNFDVHKPFTFGEFGISELDELREIVPKKKNAVVQDLMNSLSRRKHMELEPKIKIPGLECNRSLPENVLFVNNMVIEEPECGIFFTDEFGDQVFQRWSDIDKVGMEALVSYLVAALMVKSPKNARFGMKLKKLIIEHPDQEKLKSKKVKMETLGYEMN
ncbi:hypothetical protein Tco_0073844 [Tanacetum coccineum]